MNSGSIRPGSHFTNINNLGVKYWNNSKKSYPILEEFAIPSHYLIIDKRHSQEPSQFFYLNTQLFIFIVFELALKFSTKNSQKGLRVYFSDPEHIEIPAILADNIRENPSSNNFVLFGVSARNNNTDLWYDLADFLEIYFLEEIEVRSPSQDNIY